MDKARQVDLDKLAQRISELTPREKYDYINQLKQEIKLLNSKVKVKEALVEKYDSIPTERNFKGAGVLAGLVAYPALGLIISALGTENFSLLELSSIEALKGVMSGYAVALLNGVCYGTKPVSNKVNDLRKYVTTKQISKMERKIEDKTYVDNKLEEMERD